MRKGNQSIKRVLSFIMVLAMVFSLLPVTAFAAEEQTNTVYFVPSSEWKADNAWFAMWAWADNQDGSWYTLSDSDGDEHLEAKIPADRTNIIFCRMNPQFTTPDWGGSEDPKNVWSQTANLKLENGNNCYTGSGWNDGVWSVYTPSTGEGGEEDVPAETVTVYFRNDWNWPEVYVHYWNGDDNSQTTAWPGDKMTFVETVAEGDIYTAEIPTWATKLIFNGLKEDGSGAREQTPDVIGFVDGSAYYIHWDGENKCSSFEYTPSSGGDENPGDDVTPEPKTVTVHYKNESGWENVYGYAWDASGSYLNGVWPGSVTTESVNNEGWYTMVLKNITATNLSVIFNKGEGGIGNQTADILLENITDGAEYWCIDNPSPSTEAPEGWTADTGNGDENPDTPPAPTATYIIAGDNESVFGTAWDPANKANQMTLNAESGLYEKIYEDVAIGTLKFKVTDGTWTNCWGGGANPDGDGNYVLSVSAISNVTISFDAATNTVTAVAVPTGEVQQPVEYVTLHYRNTNVWETVNAYVWDLAANTTFNGEWPGTAITENSEHANWYTVEITGKNAEEGIGFIFNSGSAQTADIKITKSGEYWYDDGLYKEAPESWADGTVAKVDYQVTLHFANSLNWGGVNLYVWGAHSNGGWPGAATAQDAKGFYTASYTYSAVPNQGLNFIFSGGGSQTVDLALTASDFVENEEGIFVAEKWVVPTTTDSEGKYYADIVNSPDAIAISPVVKDTSVTFQYKGATTDTVKVFGSWDNWANGIDMTPNAYDVFSATVENVSGGLYEYKFTVNDEWICDPLNNWIENGNSAFLISDPEKDINKITVRVHFDAPSAEWNVCAWGAPNLEPQYNFENGVATIELVGRSAQYLAFKVRQSVKGNSWYKQSGEIRVDLSNYVSGTFDVYVDAPSAGYTTSQKLNGDVVSANKIAYTQLDYDNNTITVVTSKAVADPQTAFSLYRDGEKAEIIDTITSNGSGYVLTLKETLDLISLYRYTLRFSEQAKFTDYDYEIGIDTVYASDKFAAEYTYTGTDLGATYSASSTKFVVWAPTAENVAVKLYATGSDSEAGAADLGSYQMTKGAKGEWIVSIEGDLKNVYYTYSVTVDGKTVEACDPYARTTGVNGKRAMVVDLDSTDPANWATDGNPNPIKSYTDAVIYELHVRDFSIDDSSGVSAANRGKYLAFTEEGTTTANGVTTGIDYLDELGITHLHLLPIYDYGSVDETKLDTPQFNWGYDPVNYNVPEGSYSTNPYDGNVRVNEMKQMIQALHDADISVIMDVVYNHVYDAGAFCYNQIVPNYFSRTNIDGSYSEGSGCGNDTASEREMVRKYIVESVLYWTEEYHIDGFRFDLVGLLDATTINQIVNEVHKIRPDVIFYGEGWTMGTAVEPGNTMATQANSGATPDFAYFSDTIRNLLGGENGRSLGFVSGLTGKEENVAKNFMATPGWTSNPTQIVQYASCHDNYTLMDKIILSTGKSAMDAEAIKMNNLAAAIYMTSQGIPFIHAGEEFLREKLEEDGGRCENSYNAPDSVNHIKWSNLENEIYANNSAYYQGLIAFRKAHPALRLATTAEVRSNVSYKWVTNEVVMFTIDGKKVADETHDKIVVIFNANKSEKNVKLPEGEWTVCVNADKAGTDALGTASGTVSVPGISAMVLVQGENSVRNEKTGKKYATLSAALADAENGQTLEVLQDIAVEGTLMVSDNVTLDLNSYTLTSDYVVVFSGSNLIDSGASKGILKVAKDNISLPADNSYLPVWNDAAQEEDAGYIFADASAEQQLLNEDYAGGLFEVVFRPEFGKLDMNTNIFQFFQDADGASDNGIQMCLRMRWKGKDNSDVYQTFVYNKALVQEVYRDNRAFSLGVRSMGSISEVFIQVVVTSDTGVEITSTEFSYSVN